MVLHAGTAGTLTMWTLNFAGSGRLASAHFVLHNHYMGTHSDTLCVYSASEQAASGFNPRVDRSRADYRVLYHLRLPETRPARLHMHRVRRAVFSRRGSRCRFLFAGAGIHLAHTSHPPLPFTFTQHVRHSRHLLGSRNEHRSCPADSGPWLHQRIAGRVAGARQLDCLLRRPRAVRAGD
jgi:hypothetical protein